MKVSVIIPVYNVEKYIRQCLDSLVNQSLRDIEIICVDDGSTDKTFEILQEYEKKDSRVVILQQENKYAGVARNAGIQKASGKYLIFLDSDDFFESELLKAMYDRCEEDQLDVCLCGGQVYDELEDTFKPAAHFLVKRMLPKKSTFSSKDIAEYIFNVTPPAPWTKMFRRDYIEKENIKFQGLQRTNDLCFVYTALACAERIGTVDRCLVNYRTGNATSLQATNVKSPFDFYEALKGLKTSLEERDLFQTFEKSFVNRALDTCVYNLSRAKTKESFMEMYDKLKREVFPTLNIEGHSSDFFYSKISFSKFTDIQKYSSLDLWYKGQREQRAGKEVPLIDIDSWKCEMDLTELEKSLTPLVSVIIPVYNVEAYLRECVESVLGQTLKNIEIICVDDGSTDSSLDILRIYEEEDSRVTIVEKENGGLSSARNAGMAVAKGEYIYFLDSDDYLDIRTLEFLYSEAKEKNLDQIFFSADTFWDLEIANNICGNYSNYYIRKGNYTGIFTGRELLEEMVGYEEFKPSACLQMNRRSFLEKNRLMFQEGLIHEDYLFTMQALTFSERTAYVNANLYKRRMREESIMTGTKEFRHVHAYYQVIKYMEDFAEEYHLLEDERYFNVLLKEMGKIWNTVIARAIKIEPDVLHEEFFQGEMSEKEAMDFFFYICTSSKLKKSVYDLERKLKQTNEKNKKEIQKLKTDNEKAIRRLKADTEKEIESVKSTITFRVGKAIVFIPREIVKFFRKLFRKKNTKK